MLIDMLIVFIVNCIIVYYLFYEYLIELMFVFILLYTNYTYTSLFLYPFSFVLWLQPTIQ